MKKLISLVLLLMAAFTLIKCSNENPSDKKEHYS